jgi:hypothetical protein
VIRKGDFLVVIGHNQDLRKLEEKAMGMNKRIHIASLLEKAKDPQGQTGTKGTDNRGGAFGRRSGESGDSVFGPLA